jgi:DNA-binding response OmpR family regulator
MKIIVTEDDPAIQNIFELILEKAGFEVVLEPDGMALICGQFEPPDLFVIDKQLSGVSGLDVCRHLKSSLNTGHIPIIMVSASPSTEALALEAGADDFLEKPFRKKDLLALVSKHLGQA